MSTDHLIPRLTPQLPQRLHRRSALKASFRAASGFAVLGLALLALSACGQKGPLYRPDPNDPTKRRN